MDFPRGYPSRLLSLLDIKIQDYVIGGHLPAAVCHYISRKIGEKEGRIAWKRTVPDGWELYLKEDDTALEPDPDFPFSYRDFANFLGGVRCCVRTD